MTETLLGVGTPRVGYIMTKTLLGVGTLEWDT